MQLSLDLSRDFNKQKLTNEKESKRAKKIPWLEGD
jgi:hypothetical protein